jgi:hypothetical protein
VVDYSPPAAAGETPGAANEVRSVTAVAPSLPPAESEAATLPHEEWSFAAAAAPPPAEETIVFGDSPFGEPDGFTPPATNPFTASEFSFDTEEFAMPDTESAPAASATPSVAEFDFSDEEMCGTVVEKAPEPLAGDITFDSDDESFAEKMDLSGQDDVKPSHEALFMPPTEAIETSGDAALTQAFLGEVPSNEYQEPPPLSIPSRRKQSPLFGVLIAGVALLVISVLGYFGYSSLSRPKETAPQESGKIGVRAVSSAFVKNSAAGELLVVSGEAFNEYSKPRAAVQIKVTVFDATGQSVATKNAYGGNPLTKEQLANLPLDKIEAAMANQFGDSLANMGVAPGKSIPFVVVLANLPTGAKDFSVTSAGSTVATGK